MFEFIKNVFKPKEPKRYPGVSYVEVDRVPIKKIEVKKFEPKRFNTAETEKIWRYQYTDTGEIVEKPASEAVRETMTSTRPVHIIGFVK